MSGFIINPSRFAVVDGDGAFLDSVLASTSFDLDATIEASYDGSSQIWKNGIALPSGGGAQSAYNFTLGLTDTPSTDDPTFNGTAGDPAAFFSTDGGDKFQIADSTNPFLFKDLHKTTGGPDWWICFAANLIRTTGSPQILSIQLGGAGVGSNIDLRTAVRATQRGDTAQVRVDGPSFTSGIDTVLIVSHSHSTNKTRFWFNSTTAFEVNHTYNATSTDASRLARLFSSAQAGTKIYTFAGGNEFLNDTQVGDVIAHLEARHGRIYIS